MGILSLRMKRKVSDHGAELDRLLSGKVHTGDARRIFLGRDHRLVERNVEFCPGIVENLGLSKSEHGGACRAGKYVGDGIDLGQRSDLVLGRMSYGSCGSNALNCSRSGYGLARVLHVEDTRIDQQRAAIGQLDRVKMYGERGRLMADAPAHAVRRNQGAIEFAALRNQDFAVKYPRGNQYRLNRHALFGGSRGKRVQETHVQMALGGNAGHRLQIGQTPDGSTPLCRSLCSLGWSDTKRGAVGSPAPEFHFSI